MHIHQAFQSWSASLFMLSSTIFLQMRPTAIEGNPHLFHIIPLLCPRTKSINFLSWFIIGLQGSFVCEASLRRRRSTWPLSLWNRDKWGFRSGETTWRQDVMLPLLASTCHDAWLDFIRYSRDFGCSAQLISLLNRSLWSNLHSMNFMSSCVTLKQVFRMMVEGIWYDLSTVWCAERYFKQQAWSWHS